MQNVSSTLLTYMATNEATYNCSGICSETPLFYFYGSIILGPPAKSCQTYVMNDIKWGFLLYGSFFMLCGILLILAFNIQYGMWGRGLTKKMR